MARVSSRNFLMSFLTRIVTHGHAAAAFGRFGGGAIVLFRQDADDRKHARRIIRTVCSEFGLEVLIYRSVPVVDSALGQTRLGKPSVDGTGHIAPHTRSV